MAVRIYKLPYSLRKIFLSSIGIRNKFFIITIFPIFNVRYTCNPFYSLTFVINSKGF